MAVLIYGSHRISEPLAYEVGQKVLQRAQTIKGIEDPNFQDSDWILLFNQFCEGIRNGNITEYQLHNLQDFFRFSRRKQDSDVEWTEEIAITHTGQAVYDLHNTFNVGALNKLGIDKLIPKDSPTLKYRPNDGTLAVIEITAATTDAYPNDTTSIEELARNYRLKIIYKKLSPEKEGGLIDINLPDDLPAHIGVNAENIRDLEEAIQLELNRFHESRRVEYKSRLQEALELDRLRSSCPFLIPDSTDPRYSQISDAVTEFLIEFFKLHN